DRDRPVSSSKLATMKLFTYWRSQAAFRVRIALRLKGIAIEKVSLDLLAGDQFAADYHALNPDGVVPTLIDGDGPPLTQSLAIRAPERSASARRSRSRTSASRRI